MGDAKLGIMALASLMAAALASETVPHHYDEPEESAEHKEYRAERRNKKRMQQKSKKANKR
jgi:hypothetical protein